jgi:hypothetical protein
VRDSPGGSTTVVGLAVLAGLAFASACLAESPGYAPGTVGRLRGPARELILFPGASSRIVGLMPIIVNFVTFGPQGRVIYASASDQTGPTSFRSKRGVYRIEVKQGRLTAALVPGSEDCVVLGHIFVSRDERSVVFRGTTGKLGGRTEPGVLRLQVPKGQVSPIKAPDGGRLQWVLDVAPDGSEFIIPSEPPSEGPIRIWNPEKAQQILIPGSIESVSYSRDGERIAAVEVMGDGHRRTVIIQRQDPTRRRVLVPDGGRSLVWSPDSRFLLSVKVLPWLTGGCLALETIDADSGIRRTINRSRCMATDEFGWMRAETRTAEASPLRNERNEGKAELTHLTSSDLSPDKQFRISALVELPDCDRYVIRNGRHVDSGSGAGDEFRSCSSSLAGCWQKGCGCRGLPRAIL